MAFSGLKLHPTLTRGIDDLGFTQPTPIQSEAIPAALAGDDLLASASTGSGKTAAFLLPILHQLLDRPRGTTRGLVLVPTRELAMQILEEFKGLARHTDLTAVAIYGGVGMRPQEKALRRGVDLVFATPGRLLDHFQYRYAALAGLEFLVLDEADRMLDMGFQPDIRRILKHVPVPRQTLFFSATMPRAIEKLSGEILKDPRRIALQRKAAPAAGVSQSLYPVASDLKGALLLELLTKGHMDGALVFTRTKHRANRLTKLLNRNGVDAERIHGNRSQAQRTRALAGFKAGDFRVLVATDVAARGIDVVSLEHVVNFDIPNVPEDYIHRVGRTARAEATGHAHTFFAPDDEADIARIERAIGEKLPRIRLKDFSYAASPEASMGGERRGGGGGRSGGGGRGRGRRGPKQSGGAGEKGSAQERRPRRRRYGKRPK